MLCLLFIRGIKPSDLMGTFTRQASIVKSPIKRFQKLLHINPGQDNEDGNLLSDACGVVIVRMGFRLISRSAILFLFHFIYLVHRKC